MWSQFDKVQIWKRTRERKETRMAKRVCSLPKRISKETNKLTNKTANSKELANGEKFLLCSSFHARSTYFLYLSQRCGDDDDDDDETRFLWVQPTIHTCTFLRLKIPTQLATRFLRVSVRMSSMSRKLSAKMFWQIPHFTLRLAPCVSCRLIIRVIISYVWQKNALWRTFVFSFFISCST